MNPWSEEFAACWQYWVITSAGKIVAGADANGQAENKTIHEIFPWFRLAWLQTVPYTRLLRDAKKDRWLLDILPAAENQFVLYVRNITNCRETDYLLCEISDEIISMQRFVDSFHDGVFVTDGDGRILVVNTAFCKISGMKRTDILGSTCQELVEQQKIPFSCSLKAKEENGKYSSTLQYPSGKEAFVTSVPLHDKGKIIRILSNVRDLTELNSLQAKLDKVTALMKSYQSELNSMQQQQVNMCRELIRSAKMEQVYALLDKVSNTDLRVLIVGESGVGKTALAKYIHARSDRNQTGSFVHVNCSAIPETLLEAELFGYEEGAYTGAVKGKAGLLETADKGTLFLDEIGDMPLALQAKLLNVLQENAFYRVGGRKPIYVDVRVITASNMNLQKKIQQKEFRADLFYRLNGVSVFLPRLSERREDIPPLIKHYLEIYNRHYQRQCWLTLEAMNFLVHYDWPGNIRQVCSLLERLVVTSEDVGIGLSQLRQLEEFRPSVGEELSMQASAACLGQKPLLWDRKSSLKKTLQGLEMQIIEEALAEYGSYKDVARVLGMDVATLFRKRKKVEELSPDLQK